MNKIKNEIKLIKLWDSLKTVDFNKFKLNLNNFKIIEKELEHVDLSILEENSLLKLVKNARYNVLSRFLDTTYSSIDNTCNNSTNNSKNDEENKIYEVDDNIYSLFYIYLFLFTDKLTHNIGFNNHTLTDNNHSSNSNGDISNNRELEINKKHLCRYVMYNILNNNDKENKVNKIFYQLKNDINSIKIINLFSKLSLFNIPLILPYNDLSDYVYLFQLNLIEGETCWSPYIDHTFIYELLLHGFITIALKINIAEIFYNFRLPMEADIETIKNCAKNIKDISIEDNNNGMDVENNTSSNDNDNNNTRDINITDNLIGSLMVKCVIKGVLDFENYKNYIENDIVLLMPKMHTIRCVLDPTKIKVKKKLIKMSKKFKLTLNTSFSEVLDGIVDIHGENWMYPEIRLEFLRLHHYARSNINSDYLNIFNGSSNATPTTTTSRDSTSDTTNGHISNNSINNHKGNGLVSVELWDMENNLVAGEVGFVNGAVYTSISGFHKLNNTGNLQLLLLSALLHFDDFKLWDLGMYLRYKVDMGAKCISRNEFMKLHNQHKLLNPKFEIPSKYINDNNCHELIKDFIQDVNIENSS